jgi:hypothetical protein
MEEPGGNLLAKRKAAKTFPFDEVDLIYLEKDSR